MLILKFFLKEPVMKTYKATMTSLWRNSMSSIEKIKAVNRDSLYDCMKYYFQSISKGSFSEPPGLVRAGMKFSFFRTLLSAHREAQSSGQ